MGKISLSNNEKGVSSLLKDKNYDTDGEDWWNGKSGDREAARRIVSKLWGSNEFDKLKKQLVIDIPIVVISVPSTTGKNMITEELGIKIARQCNGQFFSGRYFYIPENETQVKYMTSEEKFLNSRKFKKINVISIINNTQAIIVEDIINTGISLFSFIRQLRIDKVNIQTIAALFGDPTITPDDNTINIFKEKLLELDIILNYNDILNNFSLGEVNFILKIMIKNNYSNIELTNNLYKIINERIPKNTMCNKNNGIENEVISKGDGYWGIDPLT